MLEDDALAEEAYEVISVGIAADHAWRLALDVEIEGYRTAEDEYFRARAADIIDIRDRVLAHLSGADTVAKITGGSIVAADDITPSAFLAADWTRGGRHRARRRLTFLACGDAGARARGAHGGRAWPAVVERAATGAGPGRRRCRHRDLRSRARNASPVRAPHRRCERRARLPWRPAALSLRARPMAGGSAVLLNVATPEDLAGPRSRDLRRYRSGAHGIPVRGVLTACRTRTRQYAVYRRILDWAEGRPVTIRTLDAGGDKPIAGLTVDGESNPFLGLRGIRLSLARPEIFRVQLRALCRAAVHGPLKIMLPMIAVPSELDRAGTMLDAECRGPRGGRDCVHPSAARYHGRGSGGSALRRGFRRGVLFDRLERPDPVHHGRRARRRRRRRSQRYRKSGGVGADRRAPWRLDASAASRSRSAATLRPIPA